MENKKEKIQVKIEEIIEYINQCKLKPFSNNIILVNKDEIDSYLLDLKKCAPDEIKRYQKIIANREAIIAEAEKIKADAAEQAKEIVKKTQENVNNLVTEDYITQTAYAQSDDIINTAYLRATEIVDNATNEAQQIVDYATNESNALKESATAYADNLLAQVETVCTQYINYINSTLGNFDGLGQQVSGLLNTVQANRAELYPPVVEAPVVTDNTTDFIPVQPANPADGTSELPDLELL